MNKRVHNAKGPRPPRPTHTITRKVLSSHMMMAQQMGDPPYNGKVDEPHKQRMSVLRRVRNWFTRKV